MFKKTVNFEDFNGEQASEDLYFNLSKAELVELEVEYSEGLQETIDKLIKSKDNKEIVALFKKIILMSYGEKTPDGRSFMKNDDIREKFSCTAAYQELFLELADNSKSAAEFITGLLPRDLAEQAQKDIDARAAVKTPGSDLPPPAPPFPAPKV